MLHALLRLVSGRRAVVVAHVVHQSERPAACRRWRHRIAVIRLVTVHRERLTAVWTMLTSDSRRLIIAACIRGSARKAPVDAPTEASVVSLTLVVGASLIVMAALV
jgi:hypothetical protein